MPEQLAFILAIPTHNEAAVVAESLRRAHAACEQVAPKPWCIVLVDNGSTDATSRISKEVASELSNIVVLESPVPGKGGAIRLAWETFTAQHYAFSDVDLSVDLVDAISKAMMYMESGADIVAGSRALKDSVVVRPLKRRLISKCYRLAAKLITKTKLTDLACGFKVINQKVKEELLPKIKDQAWFFDSELLLRAEQKNTLVIKEIAVCFNEDNFSRRVLSIPLLRIGSVYLNKLWLVRAQNGK